MRARTMIKCDTHDENMKNFVARNASVISSEIKQDFKDFVNIFGDSSSSKAQSQL